MQTKCTTYQRMDDADYASYDETPQPAQLTTAINRDSWQQLLGTYAPTCIALFHNARMKSINGIP